MSRFALTTVLLAATAFLPGGWSNRSIPPHPPGIICVVPNSWCAMEIPGAVGAPCSCPGLYGRVKGALN
jgi:hypothetical protein